MQVKPIEIEYGPKSYPQLLGLFRDTNMRVRQALQVAASGKGHIRSSGIVKGLATLLKIRFTLRMGLLQGVAVTVAVKHRRLVLEVDPGPPITGLLTWALGLFLALAGLAWFLPSVVDVPAGRAGLPTWQMVCMTVAVAAMVPATLFGGLVIDPLFRRFLPRAWEQNRHLGMMVRQVLVAALEFENPHLEP